MTAGPARERRAVAGQGWPGPPARHRSGASPADLAPRVKVVPPAGGSTLTRGARPAPLRGGSTADGMTRRTDARESAPCPLRARSGDQTGELTVTRRHPAMPADLDKHSSGRCSPQPSKLVMRVRFPSPAPVVKAQVRNTLPAWVLIFPGFARPVRAISMQLAHRHEHASQAVVIVSVTDPLRCDVRVDGTCDELIGAAGPVLVDQRGSLAVVPHPRHEIFEPGAADSREVVPRMPQVVEVQALRADRPDSMRPGRHLVEVVTAQRRALLAGEHQAIGTG